MSCERIRHFHVTLCLDVLTEDGFEVPSEADVKDAVLRAVSPMEPGNDWDSNPVAIHLGQGRRIVSADTREDS